MGGIYIYRERERRGYERFALHAAIPGYLGGM
jgi:hypothetical protein